MEEIKVGEYVRDYDGFIVKVNKVQDYKEDDDIWYEEKILKGTWKSMVVKHSPNIIDLIEVGDYVNGKRVDFDKFEHKLYVGNDYDNQTFIKDMDIKTIVTKEQYKANCYEVK